jgi:hypothetical protein
MVGGPIALHDRRRIATLYALLIIPNTSLLFTHFSILPNLVYCEDIPLIGVNTDRQRQHVLRRCVCQEGAQEY